MDEDTKLLVGIRLERCREDIATARLLIREGKYRVAVSRAYYAIFMIATAVLITLGISRSKHSAVESAFGHYLVKPGIFAAQNTTYSPDLSHCPFRRRNWPAAA